MVMNPEKILGYIFLSVEVLLAIYVIYLMFGLWWVVVSVMGALVIIYVSVWVISYKYEKTNLFTEPKKAAKENFKALLIFNQVLDYLIYFPIKSILIIYI